MTIPATGESASFTCKNCGATTSAVALGSSVRCPFCGSEHVIAGSRDSNAPVPEALIPFAFPDDQVDGAYRKWLGEGFFRPKDITAKAHSHKMQAIYIPIWESQGAVQSQWQAQAGYAEEIPAPSSNPPRPPTTRTRWEYASGQHSTFYDRVLISGSKGLPQDWIGRAGDFNWGEIKGFDPNYMIGREVETSTLDRNAALSRAREEIQREEEDACRDLVPGDTQKDLRVNTTVIDLKTRLIYIPVWLASFQYDTKTYRCVVNGQSGEVSGEAPLNAFRVAAVVLAVVGLIAAIVLLIILFT